jgi:beta-lactamase class A
MYPNDPNQQPQPPQQPQPNPGWGSQPAVPPQQQPYAPVQQPQPQQPYTPYPQPVRAVPMPIAQPGATVVKRPKKVSGPFALLFNDWMKAHWKLVILVTLAVIILGTLIFQIVYPNSRLLPGTTVDGVALGGMRKDEAAKKLDDLYGDVKLNIYFGKNQAAFQTPKVKDVGVSVLNENRINDIQYPFYYRVIPGSFLFMDSITKVSGLEYAYDKQKIQDYTQSKVGDTCTIPAKDATLKLIDSQLQVVPSVPGGVCDITSFQQSLSEARPTSDADSDSNKVRIDSTEIAAKVDDDKARQLADMLNTRLKDPMPMSLGSTSEPIPGRIVLSWLDFKSEIPPDSVDDSANLTAKLLYSVNPDRMSTYLSSGIAAKVVKKPGVSKVSTTDFTETARVNGANGVDLDQDKIVASITNYIDSKTNQAVAVTHNVGPTVIYTRSYTPTSVGYSALLAQFAQDNPGKYGLAITELSGLKFPRSATYNADARFSSAGIESLYMGYAIVMDKAAGSLRPAETIAGSRNVETCMKDMIIKQDDACRLGFYTRFGFAHTTARGAELGLQNTVFADKGGVTSANDLQKVMIGLYKNQIARIEGGQTLLSIARTIRSNDGIPAGISTGSVSHLVGEDDAEVRNDTAVVYSSKGVYILTVLSDGSGWDKVASLAKKIEAFKQVKVPPNAH